MKPVECIFQGDGLAKSISTKAIFDEGLGKSLSLRLVKRVGTDLHG